MTMHKTYTIGFVGAGKVGTALATALSSKGYRIGAVFSRTHDSAARLANATGQAPFVCHRAQAVSDRCDLIFITTPDNPIAEVTGGMHWHKGQTVVHCSGALTTAALSSAAESGADVAGFHPMQTFSRSEQTLDGVTVALEGTPAVIKRLNALANDLGCKTVVVTPEEKTLYHVSGVLASNYVVTLVNLAEELWEAQGLSRESARQALVQLLKGTVSNIEERGSVQALTGPVARGDDATIAKHLETLATKAPALLAVYRELGQLTIPVAEAKGTITPRTAQKLRALFTGPDRADAPHSARAPKEDMR